RVAQITVGEVIATTGRCTRPFVAKDILARQVEYMRDADFTEQHHVRSTERVVLPEQVGRSELSLANLVANPAWYYFTGVVAAELRQELLCRWLQRVQPREGCEQQLYVVDLQGLVRAIGILTLPGDSPCLRIEADTEEL